MNKLEELIGIYRAFRIFGEHGRVKSLLLTVRSLFRPMPRLEDYDPPEED